MLGFLGRIILAVALCLGLGLAQPTEAAITREEVAFVVVDPKNLADAEAQAEWRSVVKWAYHFPYYRFTEDWVERSLALSLAGPKLAVAKEDLARLAAKHELAAIALVKVRRMDEHLVHRGWGGWRDNDGDDTYVELDVVVDLYVYKRATDSLLWQKVRQRELADLGNYTAPVETVKWALCDLVNTMEKRPLIR